MPSMSTQLTLKNTCLVIECNWMSHNDLPLTWLLEEDGCLDVIKSRECIVFEREAPQSCEFSVRCEKEAGHISAIEIVSSSRTIELYSNSGNSNDLEYISTVRPEMCIEQCLKPQDSSVAIGNSFKSRLEFNPGAFHTRIKLLSLLDKSKVEIQNMTIVIAVQQSKLAGARERTSQELAGSSLPTLPLFAQAFGDLNLEGNMEGLIMLNRVLGEKKGSIKDISNFLRGILAVNPTENTVKSPDGGMLEVYKKLDRLETMCHRLENSLNSQFGMLKDRIERIEGVLASMDAHCS